MYFIAHRGLHSSDIIENSIEAIELGSKVKYLDGVEFDVRLTKDNKVVVIHDKTIDRVSNGVGTVANMTLRQLRKYNYGSDVAPSTISTLDEVLDVITPGSLLIIELKDEDKRNSVLVTEVLKILDKYPNLNIWLKSFSSQIVDLLQNASKYPTGILVDKTSTKELLKDTYFYSISKHVIDKNIVKNLIKRDKIIMIWTINTKEELNNLKKTLGEYIDDIYIISNNPLSLLDKNSV
mgnify:FL=1